MKRFTGILFTILISAFFYPTISAADKNGNTNLSFGPGIKFDNGIQTAVAINNNGQIVEVHNNGTGILWYHTGQAQQKDISWSGSTQYDKGDAPAVALNDQGLVVEVRKTEFGSTLWYHVGKLNGTQVNGEAAINMITELRHL